jgi:hypothetical protein
MVAIFGTIQGHPTLSGKTVGVWFEGNRSFLSDVPSSREMSIREFRSAATDSLCDNHLALIQYISDPTGVMNGYDAADWFSIIYDLPPQFAKRLRKTIVGESAMSRTMDRFSEDDADDPAVELDASLLYYGIGGQTP